MNSMQYATSDSVGEWDGKEELAAEKFNLILEAIANGIDENDDDAFNNAAHYAWDNVGSDEELTSYTQEQIEAAAVAAR